MWLFLWFGRHLDFSTAFHTANFNPVNYLEENSMQPKNCSKFTPNIEHIMDVMIHYSQTSRRSWKKLRIKQRNMGAIIIIYQIYLLVVLFLFELFYTHPYIYMHTHMHVCTHTHTYAHISPKYLMTMFLYRLTSENKSAFISMACCFMHLFFSQLQRNHNNICSEVRPIEFYETFSKVNGYRIAPYWKICMQCDWYMTSGSFPPVAQWQSLTFL